MISQPFNVKNYLSAKAESVLDELGIKKEDKKAKKTKIDSDTGLEIPKKVKVDTRAETLRMFQEGTSIKDIAKMRSLTVGTIENHLAHFVGNGTLNINDIVSTQHQRFIRGIIHSFDKAYTLSDIKNNLPADYTYAEIKMVIADMNNN